MAEFDVDSTYIPALHKPSALLPVAKHRESLLYLIETNPVTVVVGQTGSGKTTQIPQFLEAAGWCSDGKIIGVTQPRRVAATTVAVRVAEEFGCELGKQVGYSIRFEDVTSEATKIKFMTDGLLIREALVDPLLSRYAVIMVDEAHERSISTDVLLGLLKKIIRRRPELRIIISSATLQADEFLRFFSSSDAPDERAGAIITLEGRTYPIDVLYREKAVEDYVKAAVMTVLDIHQKEAAGDVLVFLTGREEIDSTMRALEGYSAQLAEDSSQILALPLYAGLTTEQQMHVFEPAPANTRKIIISTNIAEASVTIDGIVYVVDCGFVKLRAFNPQTGIESLTVTSISKASAQQRAGRAGRTRPGKCFRLYREDAFNAMPEMTAPEIQRSNLAPFILQLKALGIDNVVRFDFFTAPPSELMLRATELLFSLGALDEYAKLTRPLGMRMAELALEPMMAKTLLSSPSFDCVEEMLSIAAMTTLGGSVFYSDDNKKQAEVSRRRFAAEEGDHITLLNIYQAFVTAGKKEPKFCHQNHLNYKSLLRAVSIRAQLRRYLDRFDLINEGRSQVTSPSKAESIRRCLTTGYFAHAARMQADGSFLNVAGGTVLYAHPSSLMFNRRADWVIFHEVMESGSKTFIRDITKIEKSWLLEYAEGFYHIKD